MIYNELRTLFIAFGVPAVKPAYTPFGVIIVAEKHLIEKDKKVG